MCFLVFEYRWLTLITTSIEVLTASIHLGLVVGNSHIIRKTILILIIQGFATAMLWNFGEP